MPAWRRPPFAVSLATPFAAVLTLLAAPLAAAKPKSPLELTVQNEAGAQVAGAAVAIRVESGEPFAVEGVTDKRGLFATKLPDFSRVYEIRVTKEGFVEFKQAVDLAAQNFAPGVAASLIVTLPEMRGPTAEEVFNDGVRALQANDLPTAKTKFEQAVAMKPDLATGWSVLAMLHADANRWAEALDAADKTLALKPDDLAALRARPEALTALARADEAAVALDALAAADRSPEGAKLLFNAGAAAWQAKDAAVATKRFEQALAADPRLHQAHGALAEVKIGAKDLAGALAELERGLALAPDDKKLWGRKAAVLEALGRAEEAAAAKKKLAELGG